MGGITDMLLEAAKKVMPKTAATKADEATAAAAAAQKDAEEKAIMRQRDAQKYVVDPSKVTADNPAGLSFKKGGSINSYRGYGKAKKV